MKHLLCLIFDEQARLQHMSTPLPFPPPDCSEEGKTTMERQFLGSLRVGDRKRFIEFCAEPLLPENTSVPCELFSVLGCPPFRYAFCEKNASDHRLLNAVYLAEDMCSFYPMMSPISLSYSRVTDRLIREILLCTGNPAPSVLSLTPETILALQYFPTVLQSVMAPGRGCGLCDVFRITEVVVRELQETPLFLHTTLECRSTESNPALRIIELSADVYVHILMSVLTALLSLSDDHVIRLELLPFLLPFGNRPLSVDVKLSTRVREPENYRNDCGQLQALAVPGSLNKTLLTVASVLACTVGIEPSFYMDYTTQSLNLYLTINPETNREVPGFKYRDPYQSVGTLLSEFLHFLETA